jgi:hypothetical protein
MMGKNPAFQFYPGDWTRDLEEHPLEIEGAWIRIISKLWWATPRGSLTRSLEQWSRILRASEQKCLEILLYIKNERIGDVKIEEGNAIVTVSSRRMVRDENDRESGRLRKKKFDDKKRGNATGNDEETPHVTPKSQDSSVLQSSVLAFTNVKAGDTPPPLCELKELISKSSKSNPKPEVKNTTENSIRDSGGKKAGHFSETIAGKDQGTNQTILEVLKTFRLPNFNAYQFIQTKKGAHPKALLHVLNRLNREKPALVTIEKPWPYAEKILRIEAKNYKEADSIQQHRDLMAELAKAYPRETNHYEADP